MSERTYPYDAWALQPSFKPVQVTLIDGYYEDWDRSSTGKLFHVENLFPTKEAAIAGGWKRLAEQEARLAKQQDGIAKKKAALTKAAGGSL